MQQRQQEDRMKCPKCGRFDLRDSEGQVECKTCGYMLSPGEGAKYRLFQLLREESRKTK